VQPREWQALGLRWGGTIQTIQTVGGRAARLAPVVTSSSMSFPPQAPIGYHRRRLTRWAGASVLARLAGTGSATRPPIVLYGRWL